MANHYQNGGRNVAVPDENRPSWRPQDQQASSMRNRGNEDDRDYRSWRERHQRDDIMERDPQRWEGSRGSEVGYSEDRDLGRSNTERYGQGQSGYSAGRYGDDRSQQIQNRNEMVWSGHHEERGRDLGTDDRWQRGSGSWADRDNRRGYEPERYGAQGGYGGGRGFEAQRIGRGEDERMGYDRSYGNERGNEQRMGYDRGSMGSDLRGNYGSDRYNERNVERYDRSVTMRGHEAGYSGGMGRGQDLSEGFNRGTQDQRHAHRGTGPHRGKGPMGYQRSDERIREMVCDALADDDMIDASQIHVTVKDGEVTLTGVVDTRQIKREAEDCVSNVAGVKDVQIQLRIKDEKASMSTQGGQGGTQNTSSSTSSTSSVARDNGMASKHEPDVTSASQDKKHRA